MANEVRLSDQGVDELQRRVFSDTPAPLPPLQRPGVESRDDYAQQLMRGQAPMLGQGSAPLDPKELPRARALARILSQLIQNTNVTAALPAHVQPPLWSTPVDLSATVTLPAAVGQYQTVLAYTVPQGRWARIEGYGVDVPQTPAFTYDGSILWQIAVNGNPVPTLDNWGEHRGSVIQPANTVIVLRENDRVTFNVRRAVAAAGTSRVVMALRGWQWLLRYNYEGTKAVLTST